jgi:hypothetical protein
MRFTDTCDLRGEVIITATDDSGKTTILVEDKNLIVLNGRRLVANHILSGSGAYITDVAFGYGGTSINNPNDVIQVLPTETSVKLAIPNLIINTDYVFTADSSSLIDSNSRPKLIYNIHIPKTNTNVNGKQINELALMLNTTPTASAFAIKRFATIVKSESISLNIKWTIFC